jgi:poly-gamma-glutamate capsule biosynthesis protein CapA/YwtB (metallophosphatase superfamily)
VTKRWFGVLPIVLAVVLAACASPAGAPETAPSSIALSATSITSRASPTSSPTPTPTATPRTGRSLTISAVGDVSLARGVIDQMNASGAAYPFALVTQLIEGDIGFANLEGPLTDRGSPWPKGYNFRTPPRFVSSLVSGRIGVVTLANNHTLDFGADGLIDTLAALDSAGVRHVGAGKNAMDAHAPAVVDANGLHVAFLGCVATPDEGGGFSIRAWEAGPVAPGVALCSHEGIVADVAASRRVADFVVVAIHAGDEYHTAPNTTQREMAAAALAAGADAVIGAHAHVVQPIELRDGRLVAFGLGNFVFALDDVDRANIPIPRVTLVLEVSLTEGAGVSGWQARAAVLDDAQSRPRPATPAEAAALRAVIGPDQP